MTISEEKVVFCTVNRYQINELKVGGLSFDRVKVIGGGFVSSKISEIEDCLTMTT